MCVQVVIVRPVFLANAWTVENDLLSSRSSLQPPNQGQRYINPANYRLWTTRVRAVCQLFLSDVAQHNISVRRRQIRKNANNHSSFNCLKRSLILGAWIMFFRDNNRKVRLVTGWFFTILFAAHPGQDKTSFLYIYMYFLCCTGSWDKETWYFTPLCVFNIFLEAKLTLTLNLDSWDLRSFSRFLLKVISSSFVVSPPQLIVNLAAALTGATVPPCDAASSPREIWQEYALVTFGCWEAAQAREPLAYKSLWHFSVL